MLTKKVLAGIATLIFAAMVLGVIFFSSNITKKPQIFLVNITPNASVYEERMLNDKFIISENCALMTTDFIGGKNFSFDCNEFILTKIFSFTAINNGTNRTFYQFKNNLTDIDIEKIFNNLYGGNLFSELNCSVIKQAVQNIVTYTANGCSYPIFGQTKFIVLPNNTFSVSSDNFFIHTNSSDSLVAMTKLIYNYFLQTHTFKNLPAANQCNSQIFYGSGMKSILICNGIFELDVWSASGAAAYDLRTDIS